MIKRILRLRKAGLLGLNCRNGDYILQYNDRRFYPLVDDKVLCKQRLVQRGLPVPALIGLIELMHQTSHINEVLGDHAEFVIKPAHGSGGDGILVITGRRGDYFIDADSKMVEQDTLEHHLTNVIGGLYSLGGQPDVAMIESLVHFDPAFSRLTYHGVPDIRVIVYKGYPVMCMSRLPTRRSHGKANLHQGAIGVGIDLASGITMGGVSDNNAVSEHPDTGAPIAGFQIPGWDKILHMGYRFVDPKTFPELPTDEDRRIRRRCLEYFAALDGFLRQLVELNGDEGRVFVVSDHGFGPSSFVFRCNTWLAEQGYLFWQDLDSLEGAARQSAEKVADGHFVLLDWDRTTAYARTVTSNGIFIRVANRPGEPGVPRESYAAFREELVSKLLKIPHPETGQPIVKDVLRKEQFFPGPHNAHAPDLTLVMSDHGFISVKNKQPTVLIRPFIEGTHHPNGIFLASGPGIQRGVTLSDLSVLDVTPCLLYSLGLPLPSDLEGRLPEEAFEPSFLARRPFASGPATLDPEQSEQSLEDSGLLEEDEEEAVYQRLKSLGYME